MRPLDEYNDWIEIYNRSSVPRDLGGMYLTDNLKRPNKWGFPRCHRRGLRLFGFWADDREKQGELHTNFKLSADGEEIGLFDTDVRRLLTALFSVNSTGICPTGGFRTTRHNGIYFQTQPPAGAIARDMRGQSRTSNSVLTEAFIPVSSEAFDVSLSCETPERSFVIRQIIPSRPRRATNIQARFLLIDDFCVLRGV
jgi:hypothetical protein